MSFYNEMDDLLNKVYMRFGLTYCVSECLHRELCIVYTVASFKNQSHITKPRIEEKMSYAFLQTLGKITLDLKGILPDELFSTLEFAVGKRNFLAHHFWYERAHLMTSLSGLEQMIKELSELYVLFSDLDRQITDYFDPEIKQLGITDELLQNLLIEVLSGEPPKPLPKKRKIEKSECLKRVWEFDLPDGTRPLIFETDDGCLWQFCDVGLGWTNYDKVGVDWRKNKIIQPYLPARINPRPKGCQPWEYEFMLKKNVILWVKPGKREKSFKWGIRDNSKN